MEKLRIIHVDMDAFFAAIEIRDDPSLKGKPIIIGGADPRARGVVSTASYEARKYGVGSAMPLVEAYRRCPEGIFLQGNMGKYEKVSHELMAILGNFTPLVEPISLDEAFLDIKGCEGLFGDAVTMGKKMQKAIKKELGLTASVGIAVNKFLAKIASDLEKPEGLVVVRPGEHEEFLQDMPVEKLWGVGGKTAKILREQGLYTLGQVARMEPSFLEARLGSNGRVLSELARGIDMRAVIPSREIKSIGREQTFPQDIQDRRYMETVMYILAEDVARRLRLKGLKGKVVTVKLRYSDFKTVTRRRTLNTPTNIGKRLFDQGLELLCNIVPEGVSFRLIGLSVSGLQGDEKKQLALFAENEAREEKIATVMDELRNKYGDDIITPARFLELRED